MKQVNTLEIEIVHPKKSECYSVFNFDCKFESNSIIVFFMKTNGKLNTNYVKFMITEKNITSRETFYFFRINFK